MFKTLGLALAGSLMLAGASLAADAIVGDWKTDSGATAGIAQCGGGFCIKLKTGKHKGKSIGQMNAEGGSGYSGTVTDPANDKTYSGSATVSGNSLRMKGCVLGGLICRSQNWQRL